MERSANVEAISHFTRGLELLESRSDSIERSQQELSLQMALGGSLMVIKGQAAPEAGNAYARALELCRQRPKPRGSSLSWVHCQFFTWHGDNHGRRVSS